MKKIILITLISLSSLAMATPIEIKITTHGDTPESQNVKIKLSKSNDWINLGPIYLGENKFNIDTEVDGHMGTILFEGRNNRLLAAQFSKNEDIDAINFEIKKPDFISQKNSTSDIEYSFPSNKESNIKFMSNIYETYVEDN